MKHLRKTLSVSSPRPSRFDRQSGMTLMETLVALALSLIVTTAMVVLMASSVGTANRIIQMSQLSDQLRNAMSMMTRDVRRANYSANSIFCYGNSTCGESGGIAEQAGDISIEKQAMTDDGDCFAYSLDRGFDGNAANDPVGGFRLVPVGNVNVIEMWTGDAESTFACDANPGEDGWIEITDPRIVNVVEFTVTNQPIDKEFVESETSSFTNRQRQIQIYVEGELVIEDSLVAIGAFAGNVVNRRIQDTIFVRNDFIVL